MRLRKLFWLVLVTLFAGCATLEQLRGFIQPPQFDNVDGRPAEIRILPPSRRDPLGSAGVRVWVTVKNPNPFGFTLSTLQTTLSLEGRRAATGDFPLGLPLGAGQVSEIPIDLSISFQDIPGLANVIRRAGPGDPIEYQLDGTVGVEAGRFGTPTFGPMLIARGDFGIR
jgi:Late embryogenesis abundant protein